MTGIVSRMTKYRIQLGLIIILVLFVLSLLLAQKADPNNQPFFGLKRLQEKTFLKLKPDAGSKVDYLGSLLDVRLLELQNLVKNQQYNYILSSSLRYSTFAGQITELIIANNLTDKVGPIKNQFLNHQTLLDALYIAYPKNIPDDWEWKYIQDSFNYLGLYLNKLAKFK